MIFTEKEIELVQQLKEAGLDWKPSFGDVVLITDELLTREYRNALKWKGLTTGAETHGDYFTGIVIGTLILLSHIDIELAIWDSRRWTIWCPLWYQCRNIMLEKGWILRGLIETPPHVEWRIHLVYEHQDDNKVIEATGKTDLEAMYKAVLGCLAPSG